MKYLFYRIKNTFNNIKPKIFFYPSLRGAKMEPI